MKILHTVAGTSDHSHCKFCGIKAPVRNVVRALHTWTLILDKWEDPPYGYVNCMNPLAKVLEVQES